MVENRRRSGQATTATPFGSGIELVEFFQHFVRTSGSVTALRRQNWILVAVAKLGFSYDKVRVHGKDSGKKIECLSY